MHRRERLSKPSERKIPGQSWTDPGSSFGVFSTVFAITALPAGILFGTLEGDVQSGISFGLLFGVFFAAAIIPFLRTGRSTYTYSDREQFEQRITLEMLELSYTPSIVNPSLTQFVAPQTGVFEIGPIKNMTAGHLNRISVHFGTGEATLIGPRYMLKKVIARLGDNNQQS